MLQSKLILRRGKTESFGIPTERMFAKNTFCFLAFVSLIWPKDSVTRIRQSVKKRNNTATRDSPHFLIQRYVVNSFLKVRNWSSRKISWHELRLVHSSCSDVVQCFGIHPPRDYSMSSVSRPSNQNDSLLLIGLDSSLIKLATRIVHTYLGWQSLILSRTNSRRVNWIARVHPTIYILSTSSQYRS